LPLTRSSQTTILLSYTTLKAPIIGRNYSSLIHHLLEVLPTYPPNKMSNRGQKVLSTVQGSPTTETAIDGLIGEVVAGSQREEVRNFCQNLKIMGRVDRRNTMKTYGIQGERAYVFVRYVCPSGWTQANGILDQLDNSQLTKDAVENILMGDPSQFGRLQAIGQI
jgi:hypothetical protein